MGPRQSSVHSHSLELIIFKCILETYAFDEENWKQYAQTMIDAGMTSIGELLKTSDTTLQHLEIPEAPLARILQFKSFLTSWRAGNDQNCMYPLSANISISNYAFLPEFRPQDYLVDVITMTDKDKKVQEAIETFQRVEYDGLTSHQAFFIALYCQKSLDTTSSFYNLINKTVQKQTSSLQSFYSALYLLNSGLLALPRMAVTTWRGMNCAPDLEKFVVDQDVCFSEIGWWSTSKNTTLAFMEMPPEAGTHRRTLWKLDVSHGMSVSKWSVLPNEKQVVTSFCSRWQVVRVEENHSEAFDFGDYKCDFYIELKQLEYDQLFNQSEQLVSGLELLAKIPLHRFPTDNTDFRQLFVPFFDHINNKEARSILVHHLADVWNPDTRRFTNDSMDISVYERVTNLFMGIESLQDELEENTADLARGLKICTRECIYSAKDLLFNTDVDEPIERTTTDFQALGFSYADADKLCMQEKKKRELVELYNRMNLKGSADNPRNWRDSLADKYLKHYIFRDGVCVTLHECVRFAVVGCRSRPSKSLIEIISKYVPWSSTSNTLRLDKSHVMLSTAFFALEFGLHSFQLWHGDITLRQYLRTVGIGFVTMGATSLAGIVIAMIGMASFIGLGIGLGAGLSTGILLNRLLQYYFPDGREEEINAARKLYNNALVTLNCTPTSTFAQIQRSYYDLALANHPDKNDNKEKSTENFQKFVAAFEIVKTYHEVLNDACRLLGIPVDTLDNETVRQWKYDHSGEMDDDDKRRALIILERHVKYTSTAAMNLRRLLDPDTHHNLDEDRTVKRLRGT